MLILFFQNILKFQKKAPKRANTWKNLKKTAKKIFQSFITKKGLFYAKFFEFEVKSYASFWGGSIQPQHIVHFTENLISQQQEKIVSKNFWSLIRNTLPTFLYKATVRSKTFLSAQKAWVGDTLGLFNLHQFSSIILCLNFAYDETSFRCLVMLFCNQELLLKL